jgi:hypothetical protein
VENIKTKNNHDSCESSRRSESETATPELELADSSSSSLHPQEFDTSPGQYRRDFAQSNLKGRKEAGVSRRARRRQTEDAYNGLEFILLTLLCALQKKLTSCACEAKMLLEGLKEGSKGLTSLVFLSFLLLLFSLFLLLLSVAERSGEAAARISGSVIESSADVVVVVGSELIRLVGDKVSSVERSI